MLMFLALEACFKFINNFYVDLCLCLIEGLFGGITYVAGMYYIRKDSKEEYK